MIRIFLIFLINFLYSSTVFASYPYKPFACEVTVKLTDYSKYKDEKDKKFHSLAKIEIIKVNTEYTAINVAEELYGAKKSCQELKPGEILKVADFEDHDKITHLEQGIILKGTLSLIKSNPKLGYRFYNIQQIQK